jgi:hypothetical protein
MDNLAKAPAARNPALTCAGGNVIALHQGIQISRHPAAFDRLTQEIILARFRAGTLPEGIIVALLAGAGRQQP